MEKLKHSLRFLLGIPVTLLSIFFIFRIFINSKEIILKSLQSIDLLVFTIGIFFYFLFFLIKSFVWLEILNLRGHDVPRRRTAYYYALSDLKRYIPLGIISLLTRVTSLSGEITKGEVVKAIGIESFLLVFSALVMSVPALIYSLEHTGNQNLFLIFGFILAIIVLSFFLFYNFKKYLDILFRYYNSFLLVCLSWICFSIASFLVLASITSIRPENLIFVLSYFILSWLIGYLSFITPMGLGVRELAITGSLSFFIPIGIASSVAILSRIAMIFGELYYIFALTVFYKLKKENWMLRLDPYKTILVFLTFLYSIYFTYFTFLRHTTFISGRFDLGNMSQTVWNTLHGNFLILTNPDGIEKISRLSIHTDAILILLTPFYFVWSDPRSLLFIQTIVIALGSFFVYGISNIILKDKKISLLLATSYLLNFWIQEQNIFDFHAVSLATTFLLATFFYLLKKNYYLFFVFLILSVLTKENLFLISFLYGLYFVFIEKKVRIGTFLSAMSLLIFYFLMMFLIPYFRGHVHFASSYYSYLGSSLKEIFSNIIFHPNILLGQIFKYDTLDYLNKLLLPTGYLSLLSPLYLIFAMPDLVINILSSNSNLISQDYHYGANIVPFIYISSIYGVVYLKNRFGEKSLNIIFNYLIIITAVSTYLYSPLPGMRISDTTPYRVTDNKKIESYLKVIPSDASVSASNNVAAHLSNRDSIYVVPRGMDIADYVVFYNENARYTSQINTLDYDLMISSKNFLIYKRKI